MFSFHEFITCMQTYLNSDVLRDNSFWNPRIGRILHWRGTEMEKKTCYRSCPNFTFIWQIWKSWFFYIWCTVDAFPYIINIFNILSNLIKNSILGSYDPRRPKHVKLDLWHMMHIWWTFCRTLAGQNLLEIASKIPIFQEICSSKMAIWFLLLIQLKLMVEALELESRNVNVYGQMHWRTYALTGTNFKSNLAQVVPYFPV